MDEVVMTEPMEHAKTDPSTTIDMILEDVELGLGAARFDKSNQHFSNTIVNVPLAGTAQQACQEK